MEENQKSMQRRRNVIAFFNLIPVSLSPISKSFGFVDEEAAVFKEGKLPLLAVFRSSPI